jgi:hypothetical protein
MTERNSHSHFNIQLPEYQIINRIYKIIFVLLYGSKKLLCHHMRDELEDFHENREISSRRILLYNISYRKVNQRNN